MDKQFQVTDVQRVGLGRGFRFEAGHVLPGYDGKCAEPHGHSYHGRVHVSVPRARADACGIVLDFDVLKAAIYDCIVSRYDHHGTLEETAETLVLSIATDLTNWFTSFAGKMLPVLGKDRYIPPDVEVERVILYETENCFAEWRRGGF